MSTQQFIAQIGPAAQASQRKTGISAAFVIAQAALESGWGGSELAQRGKNLFGVKVYPGWEGASMQLPTREYLEEKWVTVQAQWCVYLSWKESITDHARFLFAQPKYSQALKVRAMPVAFALELQRAVYATDPQYASKIAQIIKAHSLDDWDVPEGQWVLEDWAHVA